MSAPRLITASEILAERAALRTELGYIPHGTGRGWSSMFWVYCDCPNCRDEYDPTGEESAKYLNMDHESFFRGQSDKPSFAFSKIAKESFLAHSKPGFYVGKRRDCLSLEQVKEVALQAPLILHIGADYAWNEYIPSEDETVWRRRGYKDGRSVWFQKEEDKTVPADKLLEHLASLVQ
jgi:hypothetical protein